MVVLATEDTVQRASMLLSSLGELALLPPDSAEVGQFEARMRAFKAKMGDLSPHSAHVDGHEHDPGSPSLKYAATADSNSVTTVDPLANLPRRVVRRQVPSFRTALARAQARARALGVEHPAGRDAEAENRQHVLRNCLPDIANGCRAFARQGLCDDTQAHVSQRGAPPIKE